MGQRLDITGQRYGRLVAIRDVGRIRSARAWLCRCDCGTERAFPVTVLRNGNTQSCGCYHRQRAREGNLVHGHGRKVDRSPEYGIWKNMKTRCYNAKTAVYSRYGGRGIRMCDRWRDDYAAFFADVGPRPSPQHSIDRIDNNGNYEPGNVRWATDEEQRRNRSDSKMTADLVNEIRGRAEHGESRASIARRLGLAQTYVGDIVKRRYWKEIP